MENFNIIEYLKEIRVNNPIKQYVLYDEEWPEEFFRGTKQQCMEFMWREMPGGINAMEAKQWDDEMKDNQ